MEYLKYVKCGSITPGAFPEKAVILDTHGLMAKIRVSGGTVYVFGDAGDGEYPLEDGDTLDFIGVMCFYGSGEISYILFDGI